MHLISYTEIIYIHIVIRYDIYIIIFIVFRTNCTNQYNLNRIENILFDVLLQFKC